MRRTRECGEHMDAQERPSAALALGSTVGDLQRRRELEQCRNNCQGENQNLHGVIQAIPARKAAGNRYLGAFR
jgi:hypothetical protein